MLYRKCGQEYYTSHKVLIVWSRIIVEQLFLYKFMIVQREISCVIQSSSYYCNNYAANSMYESVVVYILQDLHCMCILHVKTQCSTQGDRSLTEH